MLEVAAAGVLFEDDDGRILVLRRRSNTYEGDLLGLPAGSIEQGETPVDAAVREVREEIGVEIQADDLQLLRTYEWHRDQRNVTFHVFKPQVWPGAIEVDLDLRESSAYHWLPPAELVRRDDLMSGLYPILRDEYGRER